MAEPILIKAQDEVVGSFSWMVPKLCFSLSCHSFGPVDLMQRKLIPGKILCDQQDWLLLPAVSARLCGAPKHNCGIWITCLHRERGEHWKSLPELRRGTDEKVKKN